MSKIVVPIANGFEEIEAITIVDVCRRAGIEVDIASVEEMEVIGAHNIKLEGDTHISAVEAKDYDMVVLPGGLPNAYTLAENPQVQTLLKKMKSTQKHIGAICAAPYALNEADVLNKNYTCYPSFEEKIRVIGYNENKDVVIDGRVITSRGPATAMHFALEIVKLLRGNSVHDEMKAQLLVK